MTETQREEFLDAFREQDTPTVGFCVMGGIFSEGIDLQNEAVIGVVILAAGMILSIFLPLIFPNTEFKWTLINFAYYSFLLLH